MTRMIKKTSMAAKVEHGSDHTVIHPHNVLKAKAVVMHNGPHILDETAIRRAEIALQGLSSNFNGWMEEACRTLVTTHQATKAAVPTRNSANTFHRAAHDIRGHGTTLGFPLATRVAASLCLLLENLPDAIANSDAVSGLVDQHVDAIRAITREGVIQSTHRVGEMLTAELEAITERLVARFNGQTVH
jgi:chemotaxis protein histidine kinase CheA